MTPKPTESRTSKSETNGRIQTATRDQPKEVLEFEQLFDEVAPVQRLLRRESDRGCALIGGAALDEALGGLLTTFFVNDKALCRDLAPDPACVKKFRDFGDCPRFTHRSRRSVRHSYHPEPTTVYT